MSQSNSSSSKSAQDLPYLNSLRTVYADKQVGECLEFGRYRHGAKGEIEPITWRVLRREADHLLVTAVQGLECKRYNDKRCAVTWASCTLHRWLNFKFYGKAFNEQEYECILQTRIVNDDGQGTEDHIFLLSVDEASSLFANRIERSIKPTEYAVNYTEIYTDANNGCCCWWLRRSRGGSDEGAPYVSSEGGIAGTGCLVDSYSLAVRPALRLAL